MLGIQGFDHQGRGQESKRKRNGGRDGRMKTRREEVKEGEREGEKEEAENKLIISNLIFFISLNR